MVTRKRRKPTARHSLVYKDSVRSKPKRIQSLSRQEVLRRASGRGKNVRGRGVFISQTVGKKSRLVKKLR